MFWNKSCVLCLVNTCIHLFIVDIEGIHKSLCQEINFSSKIWTKPKSLAIPITSKIENSSYYTKIVTIQSFQKWGTHQNHNKARESVLSLWIKSCAVKINCSLVVSLKYLKLNFLSSSKIPNKTMLDLRQCSRFPQQVSCK